MGVCVRETERWGKPRKKGNEMEKGKSKRECVYEYLCVLLYIRACTLQQSRVP